MHIILSKGQNLVSKSCLKQNQSPPDPGVGDVTDAVSQPRWGQHSSLTFLLSQTLHSLCFPVRVTPPGHRLGPMEIPGMLLH